jgi:hypothetical protein
VIEDQPHLCGRGRAGYLAARGELGWSPGWTEPAWGELDAEAEVLDPRSRWTGPQVVEIGRGDGSRCSGDEV